MDFQCCSNFCELCLIPCAGRNDGIITLINTIRIVIIPTPNTLTRRHRATKQHGAVSATDGSSKKQGLPNPDQKLPTISNLVVGGGEGLLSRLQQDPAITGEVACCSMSKIANQRSQPMLGADTSSPSVILASSSIYLFISHLTFHYTISLWFQFLYILNQPYQKGHGTSQAALPTCTTMGNISGRHSMTVRVNSQKAENVSTRL